MIQKSLKLINIFSNIFILFFLFGSLLNRQVFATSVANCLDGICATPTVTEDLIDNEDPNLCPCSFTNIYPGNEFGPMTVACGDAVNAGGCGGGGWSMNCLDTQKLHLSCDIGGGANVSCANDSDCADDGGGGGKGGIPSNTPVPTAVPTVSVVANIKCNLAVNGLTPVGTYPYRSYTTQSGQNYSSAITLAGQKDGVGASLNLEVWRAPYSKNCWYGYNYLTVPAECLADIKKETAFSNKLQNDTYTLLTDFKTADQQNVTTGSYDLVCNAKDVTTNNTCTSNPYITPGANNMQNCGAGGRAIIHVVGPSITPPPECVFNGINTKLKGDANCDGIIDVADYTIWFNEFINESNGVENKKSASFNLDERVDLIDYEIWRNNRLSGGPMDSGGIFISPAVTVTTNPIITQETLPVSVTPTSWRTYLTVTPKPTSVSNIRPSYHILPVTTTQLSTE